MTYFGKFYLDKEKDVIVTLNHSDGKMSYILETPNHGTGNLITNLAKVCNLPITFNAEGLKVIEGEVPYYFNGENRKVYILRTPTDLRELYPASEDDPSDLGEQDLTVKAKGMEIYRTDLSGITISYPTIVYEYVSGQ